MDTSEPRPGARCAVVGGGVSGIATAHVLQGAGVDVEILESEATLGGRVGSAQLDGHPVDLGGKNIGKRYRLFREFARSLGVDGFEPFGLNSSRVEGGKVITFDGERRLRTLADFLRRCDLRDVTQLAAMLARVKLREEEGFLGGPWFTAAARRKDDRPLAAHFRDELCRLVLRPMTVRMNGAEPDEVYWGNFGSNLRMLLDSYEQIRGGMGTLWDRFARTHVVRLGTRVEALQRRAGGGFDVQVIGPDGERRTLSYDGVVLATPATAAARLLSPHLPAAASQLEAIRYFPVATVVGRYAGTVFPARTRAFVFDAHHPLSNAGAYGKGSLDVVRYTFSGRTARPLLEGTPDFAALLRDAERALATCLGAPLPARLGFVGASYVAGLCAYSARHAERMARVRRELGAMPGLHLTGDYVRGASIEACFRAAHECARAVQLDLLRAADLRASKASDGASRAAAGDRVQASGGVAEVNQ